VFPERKWGAIRRETDWKDQGQQPKDNAAQREKLHLTSLSHQDIARTRFSTLSSIAHTKTLGAQHCRGFAALVDNECYPCRGVVGIR
jgi:hypothetical protein